MHKISRPLAPRRARRQLVPLAGCATLGGGGRTTADTRYVARDVNTLYNAAWDRMRARQLSRRPR